MKFPSITTAKEFEEHYQNDVWFDSAKRICGQCGISFHSLKRAANSEHIVFLVDDAFVIKIFTPFRRGFQREKAALEFACGKTSLKIPEMIATGKFENYAYIVTTQLAGELMTRKHWLTFPEKEQIAVLTELAAGLKELHSHNADSFND